SRWRGTARRPRSGGSRGRPPQVPSYGAGRCPGGTGGTLTGKGLPSPLQLFRHPGIDLSKYAALKSEPLASDGNNPDLGEVWVLLGRCDHRQRDRDFAVSRHANLKVRTRSLDFPRIRYRNGKPQLGRLRVVIADYDRNGERIARSHGDLRPQ